MPSNNSLIPSLWAAKRAKPALSSTPAQSVAEAALDSFFLQQTNGFAWSLSTALNAAGDVDVSSGVSAKGKRLFPLSGDRFCIFGNRSSGGNLAVFCHSYNTATNVLTQGNSQVIRAAGDTINDVKVNPVDSSQFAVHTSAGIYLVTIGSGIDSNVTVTQDLGFGATEGAIIWKPEGDKLLLLHREATGSTINSRFFSVSGTTITAAGSTITSAKNCASGGQLLAHGVTLADGRAGIVSRHDIANAYVMSVLPDWAANTLTFSTNTGYIMTGVTYYLHPTKHFYIGHDGTDFVPHVMGASGQYVRGLSAGGGNGLTQVARNAQLGRLFVAGAYLLTFGSSGVSSTKAYATNAYGSFSTAQQPANISNLGFDVAMSSDFKIMYWLTVGAAGGLNIGIWETGV